MRCWQAKQKLNELNFDNSEIAKDKMLVNHLRECTACESLVSADNLLRADFQEASVDDNEVVVSNWQLKAQVERQASLEYSRFKENQFMAVITRLVQKQSKLTIGISTVAVVLLLSVLIPFSYNETIGYEVAFAGVDKDLALDSQKLHTLLEKLGIDGADIDVSGCEATCNVKISDLKSPDEAKLVKAAFSEIGHVILLEDVKAVFETKEGNIYKRLSFTSEDGAVNDFEFYSDATEDDMHNVLIEKLGDDLSGAISLWVQKSDTDAEGDLVFDSPTHAYNFSAEDGYIMDGVKVNVNEDGSHTFILNQGTPEEETLILPKDGVFDDVTIQKLNDIGIHVYELNNQFDKNQTTEFHTKFELKPVDDQADDADADVSAKVADDLPDGFELSQNYPNPFNPTTTIEFSIPTAEHVTLEIINMQGQIVKKLVDQEMYAGSHSIEWDATNYSGSKVASGVYLYRLTTASNSVVKKMTLLK